MKKRNLLLPLISLFSIVLTACGSQEVSHESSSETSTGPDFSAEANGLAYDNRENYEIDDSITNKDGSMSYELFVRSFYDTNNDKIGDFKGITQKMEYLSDLGIKTLWLMPIHPSPTYHGYDVKDYYDVNPDYGTMADFDEMVKKAKDYNIDIMLDMVFNHSSTENPWFEQSYQDYKNNNTSEGSKKGWYNWKTSPASKYHRYKDLYYEGQFDSSMPDLNLDDPLLRKELENITKFWIEKGVKGFRLDAIIFYYSSPKASADFLTWLKETAIKYDPNFYLVSEAWVDDDRIMKYAPSKCDSYFKFSSSTNSYGDHSIAGMVKMPSLRAMKFADKIEATEAALKQRNPDAYYSYFLSNHDMDRCEYSLRDYNAKMAASLYCLMPGTPFMYYGEEIQMKGVRKDGDNSDARRRLAMIWDEKDKTGECGFPEPHRTDLMDNEQVKKGVNEAIDTPYSLLNHYRKVINVRNKYPFMKHGVFTNKVRELNTNNIKILAYQIALGDEKIVIIHNFNDEVVEVDATAFQGMKIDSTINTARLIPTLENNKLKIGHFSSVVLK